MLVPVRLGASKTRYAWLAVALAVASATALSAQSGDLSLPPTITAGSAFSVPTSGTGKAVLYIVGPGQALRRDVQMGDSVSFEPGDLYIAGHYVVVLTGASVAETGEFDVTPAPKPETLGFLAQPSRLSVGLRNGISGAVYVFDAYHNLITSPAAVSLTLSASSSVAQTKTVTSRNGLAWAKMDSTDKESSARFVAQADGITSTRVVDEVPGDPCKISISAQPQGGKLQVQTAPVRDCSGNAIPDGTIVTFTETFHNMQSTVDVPLKQGFARVDMPAYKGSVISAACGVVAGNEIRWEGGQ